MKATLLPRYLFSDREQAARAFLFLVQVTQTVSIHSSKPHSLQNNPSSCSFLLHSFTKTSQSRVPRSTSTGHEAHALSRSLIYTLLTTGTQSHATLHYRDLPASVRSSQCTDPDSTLDMMSNSASKRPSTANPKTDRLIRKACPNNDSQPISSPHPCKFSLATIHTYVAEYFPISSNCFKSSRLSVVSRTGGSQPARNRHPS